MREKVGIVFIGVLMAVVLSAHPVLAHFGAVIPSDIMIFLEA